jgi:hypothetical protein
MKEVLRYQANDGKLFDTKGKCIDHDDKLTEVSKIISQLEDKPDSCDFSNGSGYIQQYEDVFLKVRKELLELAKKDTDHKWLQQSIDDITVDLSWGGRIIGECCIDALYRAWSRLSCIDKQFREWGQPYYSTHPEEATNKRLN